MNCAVRYYSRSGNTKLVADEIARSLDIKAVSVDDPASKINKPVDVLFIGGALYAYGIDNHLKTYLKELDGQKVKKAVVFSTSWISKHAIEVIKEELKKKGIQVADQVFYVRGKATDAQIREAHQFARKML
ncbi:flavodoxin family protein [Sharpea azabuensis]|uniref:flavodoxin family protein n=1 Tax=Sharpea azabuensis TaxID=322505 RepID=UPI0024096696|nr:flavodoxin domain-containing protein [Sharpea azabuensis]MDD6512169.1 flavodoxin domain-containing protein [Sharpea azabuensis]